MTKMERVIKYVILVSLSISVSNAQRGGGGRNQCLKNLRVIGSTPSSITLGWDYKCATGADGGMRFKVYYEHLEWRACPSGHQGRIH